MSERLKRALGRIPVHIVVITSAILWFIPTIGLLISSFRPPQDIASSGWWEVFTPPTDFTLELYEEAITARNMGQSFVNSLFITIPATIIPIMAAAFAAYAFAWLEFPGRNVLFLVVVALLAVPLQMTFIPILQIYNRAGLTGEFLGIWLAHAGFGMPFSVYLLRNSVGALPKDLFESAYLDGATSFDIFFRIVMPLVVPSIASLVIFQFLWVWNDLLVALIFLGGHPAVAPLTVTIGNLVTSLGGNWQVLSAAAFISMILPLLVFFSLQRYFVRGILAGSVKG
mgnify:CR=1 FL=1